MDTISLNGQLLQYDDARIAPGDAGLLHGAGLFETMRVRNGKIFRAADHLARISASAKTLGLDFSLTLPQLTELAADLLEANDYTDSRLRLTITRGDLHDITAENPTPPLTLLVTAAPFAPYPAAAYEKGMTVITSPYAQVPQNPLTGHKSTSYFERLLALRKAHAATAGEALWFTMDQHLAEGSISNVFLIDAHGVLSTPPVEVGIQAGRGSSPAVGRLCLPGITRKLVLELAAAAQIKTQERLLTLPDILSAREVFLTNAIMGIMPVTHLEQHAITDGKPGPVARQLREAYNRRLEEECPPSS